MAGKKISKVQFKEAQVYWDRFFSSEQYRDVLKQRILDGEAQSIEIMLYHMTYGKPKETLDLQNAGDGVFILHIGGLEVKKQAIEDGDVIDTKALPEGGEDEDERVA
jgi:hypothetical protein